MRRRHERAAAIADYNALLAASLAFAEATANLAAKQLAATQRDRRRDGRQRGRRRRGGEGRL